MPMVDPFQADAFSLASLTAAINVIPNKYGLLQSLNLFPYKGIATRTAIVEHLNGVLNLLPTAPVGSPGTVAKRGKRDVRNFRVPQIPHDDSILPDEYAGVRAFGSESEMAALERIVNDHLEAMRAKHDITLEWLRMGALKGTVLDADASTIFNYYTEFGVAQTSVDYVLGTATTKVQNKCREVVRQIEDNLKGMTMRAVAGASVWCLVHKSFFDKLVTHAEVQKAYQNWTASGTYLAGDLAIGPQATFADIRHRAFLFSGIMFVEYGATATDPEGTTRNFLATDEGYAFPMGTSGLFSTNFAPADFLETVNMLPPEGTQIWVKQEPRKFNRGVDLHSQSNPLPICTRPELVVKVTTSN